MNDSILREIAKKFKVNFQSLKKIEEYKKNIDYLKSQNFSEMPEGIKEMNLNLLKESEERLENIKCDFVIKENTEDENQIFKNLELLKEYPECRELYNQEEEIISYNLILDSDLELTETVRGKIKSLRNETQEKHQKILDNLYSFLDSIIREKFLGEKTETKVQTEVKDEKKLPDEKLRDYVVKKGNFTSGDVKQLIMDFISKNEAIFNKIIFESKNVTLSIKDRILDVSFRPNTGYVVNFISEPDTNYGKFYQNLLKVFKEIKEKLYDSHQIVVIPEEGKGLTFLNSFYQNYLFVREKADTILTKFKLQKSLLNESFKINYLIYDKLKNKYLIFYNGNPVLKEGIMNYLQNQAKLGPAEYELEFIEHSLPINEHIAKRYFKQKNHVDLKEDGNFFNLSQLSANNAINSFLARMTDVNILLEPFSYETDEELVKKYLGSNKLDMIVLTNAAHDNLLHLPRIMKENPEAKLFTSDITYKISRIKWLAELNSANFYDENTTYSYSKKDIDNMSDRIIKITPEGKGYNFRGLINVKFFNAGKFPGASIVEFRDNSSKVLYAGEFLTENNSLLKGANLKPENYDYIIVSANNFALKQNSDFDLCNFDDLFDENKQIFIFCDSFGNLQYLAQELYKKSASVEINSGDQTFDIINRELSRVINFGSSWGDNFIDKELFTSSMDNVHKFDDEYEFYKKFSADSPSVFLMPFGKEELEMVIKNKLDHDNIIAVQDKYASKINEEIRKYLEFAAIDDQEKIKTIVYNFAASEKESYLDSLCKNAKKIVLTNLQNEDSIPQNVKTLKANQTLTLY